MRLYRQDLAFIHDSGYGAVAESAAAVLVRTLRRAGIKSGLVIDLGCGSGILARAVVDAGLDILGIDISAAMLALARRRVPEGRFRRGSILSAKLPACAAVCAVGEVINYLFDRGNTARARHRLFRRIHDALCPNGVFLLDVAEPGRIPGDGKRQFHRQEKDWTVLVNAVEDRRRRLLTREIISFRKVGAAYRRDREVHRQRLLPRAQVAAELAETGFQARMLKGYGRLRFGAGVAGFLARKTNR